jgi:hypothetical protein
VAVLYNSTKLLYNGCTTGRAFEAFAALAALYKNSFAGLTTKPQGI